MWSGVQISSRAIKMECIHCNKSSKDDDFIFETGYWKVSLAEDHSYLGRCYINLKRHSGDLAELKQEEWDDFIKLVKKLESALKKAFNATMFNWTCLMNNAYQTNPPNPHVHWHFRPRYNHNVKFSGEIFEDIEFGYHYNRDRKKITSNEINRKIINKIKENL